MSTTSRRRMGVGRAAAVVLAAAAVTATAAPLPATAAASKAAAPTGPTLYVSPSGSDAAAGTAAAPLRTPQVAVDRLPSTGGTVRLAGGTYRAQRVVIAHRRDVSVLAADATRPVLDATGLVPANDLSGVVQISDSSGVTVDGLDVTGYRTTSTAKTPVGVFVTGAGSGIAVTHVHVHDLGNDNATRGSMQINAHGIAVYGTSATAALTDVHLDDNEVDHLVLGASEAIVVNGNVDGWTISRNLVHDTNNIGIDAIGYEATVPGPARYTDANRARHGFISGNTVTAVSANGNPAYYEHGSYCRCADGIYVDGGSSIDIGANTVTAADIGIEIAAENPRGRTDAVTVHDNTVTGSAYVGMTVGGYAAGRGEAADITVTGNTLTANNSLDDGSPELLLQYKVHQLTVTGNRITAGHPGDAALVQRVRAAGTAAQNAGVVLDHNDYGAPVDAADTDWTWLGRNLTGFAAWQRSSGQDAHSTFTRRER